MVPVSWAEWENKKCWSNIFETESKCTDSCLSLIRTPLSNVLLSTACLHLQNVIFSQSLRRKEDLKCETNIETCTATNFKNRQQDKFDRPQITDCVLL
jgi:hypothetical protein